MEPAPLLDLLHESCMKQQLLRHAVQLEVDAFMADPSFVHQSLFLNFLYEQVMGFPLLSSHEKAKEKLNYLIHNLPQFLTVTQRASKHDQQNKKIRVLVTGTFHLNFRTPLERKQDREILDEVCKTKYLTTKVTHSNIELHASRRP